MTTSTKTKPELAEREYTVRLRVPPGDSKSKAVRRLRAFLKSALRAWGLRCVIIEPTPVDQVEIPATSTGRKPR